MSESRNRNDRTLMLVVAILVLAFGLVFAYPRQWTRGLLINDEMWYAHLARNVAEGEGYVTDTLDAFQLPSVDGFQVPEPFKQAGYPLLVALVWSWIGVGHRSMIFVALVGYALATVAVFALFRAFGWGRRAGIVAAAVFAGSPAIVSVLVAGLPESWFIAAFLAAVLAALRPRWAHAALSGCLLAAAILVKGHGIIYVPLFAAFFALGTGRVLRTGAYLGSLAGTLAMAAWLLPQGSVQLFSSGGNYSVAFLIGMSGMPPELLDSVQPPDALATILERPLDYAVKYARMASRTKFVLDGLTAPALSGLFFPLFLGAVLAFPFVHFRHLGEVLGRSATSADSGGSGEQGTRALAWVWCLVVVTMLFFWALYPTMRFWLHVYPLMWLLVLATWRPIVPRLPSVSPEARRALVAAGALYFAVYPAGLAIWQGYRDPHAYLGRNLAVRFVDYDETAATVRRLLPEDAIVVSDMAHELNWLAGIRTIVFPAEESGLRLAIDKFEVDAILEHPRFLRDWPLLRERFEVVDTRNGRLWLRRDRGRSPE